MPKSCLGFSSVHKSRTRLNSNKHCKAEFTHKEYTVTDTWSYTQIVYSYVTRVKPQKHEYARYFEEGINRNTMARKRNIRHFLGQDRLMLQDENIFINLRCSLQFDLIS